MLLLFVYSWCSKQSEGRLGWGGSRGEARVCWRLWGARGQAQGRRVVDLFRNPELWFSTDSSYIQGLTPHLYAEGLSNIPELGSETFCSLSHARIIGCLLGLSLLIIFSFQLLVQLVQLHHVKCQFILGLLLGFLALCSLPFIAR